MSDEDLMSKAELEASKARLLYEQQITDAFREIMSTESGRKFIWYMLQECNVYRAFPVESHAEMAYLEGRRNNGLMLMARIQQDCPHQHQPMINENSFKTEKE